MLFGFGDEFRKTVEFLERFEDFVLDQERTLTRLEEYLGIPLARIPVPLATLIHYYEAWLAFLAIVVWHLYTNIVNPEVYPMNWTWLTGRISEAQMRHEHAAEYERLMREAPPAGEPDATASERPEGE